MACAVRFVEKNAYFCARFKLAFIHEKNHRFGCRRAYGDKL